MSHRLVYIILFLVKTSLFAQTPIRVGVWEKFDKYSLPPQSVYDNPTELKNEKDDDGDGFIDNLNGIGFDANEQLIPEYFYCSYDTRTDYDHGTAVASVILRHNPNVEIVGVGFLPTSKRLVASGLLSKTPAERNAGLTDEYNAMQRFIDESLRYFSKTNCKVVNISWGLSLQTFIENNPNIGDTPHQKEINARAWLGKMKQYLTEGFARYPTIIFVVAAGNEGKHIKKAVDVPATIQLPNVIVVGAFNEKRTKRASFSNHGRKMVYAHGTNISCTQALKQKQIASGTSLAAPQVTAIVAKLCEKQENIDTKSFRRKIKQYIRLTQDNI